MTISEANKPFADGIKAVITEKGLKQGKIAKDAGLKEKELSDIICGRRLVKACDISRIATVIGVSESDIFKAGRV